MSSVGATGPAPTEGNVAPAIAANADQTELEIQESRRQAERRAARLGVPLKKTSGTAPATPFPLGETIDTGIVAAVTAKQPQAEGIQRGTPPTEPSPAPKVVPEAAVAPPNALSGDTDASIEFLQERAATHPLWHPQLSFKRTDPVTGEEVKNFETASFVRDANGNPDWDKVRRWIGERQGHGNIYWTVNAAKPMNKKPGKKDIVAVVSLHVDLDPNADEDQDAAEERLTKKLEGYRHQASVIIRSGGGTWGIYDLAEPILIDGDPSKIKDVESYNIALADDLGGDDCHNIDRVARLPGTINLPNAKKLAKGRRAKLASVHSRSLVRHPITSFMKTIVDPATEAKSNGATDIKIDWPKVKSTGGWLKSVADLPDATPAKLRTIVGHSGTLEELNDQLIAAKLLEKAYRSWSEVTLAFAAGLKSSGSYTPEQIAEALLANLPCNRHVAKQTDRERAIERAISRSHSTTPLSVAVVRFRDFNQWRKPKPSLANAVIAIGALGIEASYDLFHHRIKVTYNGEAQTIREGLLTDDTVSATRSLINNTYRIDCGDANTLAAIKEIASANAYDPVLDLLNECQGKWDGVKRLDTWVIDYLGCEDTRLNRAIGRLALIAACRRARSPGCKFDSITVLEGDEGTNKSTAIRVLAGDENFSDQSILGAKDKEVQEQLDGVWMHENADLAGMKRAEVEHVKAFASRQVDRARPAYGRVREDRPRRSIEWGTTNNKEYLLSQTGNRRFWPLQTGKIDIEALKRDREQLLGEAATYEATGESMTLVASLWGDAREAQEQRRVADPWEDILASIPDSMVHKSGDGSERIASAHVLTHVLQIPTAQQTSAHGQRLARAMDHVGWKRNSSGNVTINGKPVRGYIRTAYESSVGQHKGTKVNRVPFDVAKRTCEAAMKKCQPRPSYPSP
ncbi:MAG: virulence-associated E family protein [Xanthobacteraceae bacterium]